MLTFEGLRRHLEGLVGADHIWTDATHLATHAVDGRQPRFVVQPETTAPTRSMLELERADCLALLAANSFGRLAVSGGATAPIIRRPACLSLR